MRIGLVPGSFKPYHAGHDGLIRLALSQNDKVIVFSSTVTRARKGEMPISGQAMQRVMDEFVKPSLPNVEFVSVQVPVSALFQELDNAEKNKSTDIYTIYSDEDDIKKYSKNALMKYVPNLVKNNQVNTVGVKRGSVTPDISGTEMRAYLQSGNVKKFAEMLPASLRKYSKDIIDILKSKTNEALLRSYIKSVLL